MLLADVVSASAAAAATRSRRQKVAALAGALKACPPEDVEVVVSYLSGSLRQRRTGVGWRSLAKLPEAAAGPTLSVAEVDGALEHLASLSGPGSATARRELLGDLLAQATPAEQAWLRAVLTGNVRQGALEAAIQQAVAVVTDTSLDQVRRAAMLTGSTPLAAVAAFRGEEALAEVGLAVGRPVQPMLASSAPDIGAALTGFQGPVTVDTKLDGIRIQVHRDGDAVLVATRSLDDITARLPEVVAVVRALPASRVVLDGEAVALDRSGRPRAFQETASRTAQATGIAVTPFFFDLLHLDGADLLDLPLAQRLAALDHIVPVEHRVDRITTADVELAEAFAGRVLAAGHEGVVVKDPAAPYAAGRRGAAWVKVKPRHTLDLVVLAVEWGSGRRSGWLSNIHLGARDPGSPSGWAMLGKTFKGMTDQVLAWQTERFLALATHREGHVVHVRPEQVVEIAFDGVQRSSRYPGGAALRFARVVRYRDDKSADEADTLETVRAHLARDVRP